MQAEYHPLFEIWLIGLADTNEEVFGEVMALLQALETYGRLLGDPESHPIVISGHLYALRRTPPSMAAPYADQPPVLRVIYAFCRDDHGGEVALILLGGDKTELQNQWYPPNVAEATRRLLLYTGAMGWTPLRRR